MIVSLCFGARAYLGLPSQRGTTIKPARIEVRLGEEVEGGCRVHNGQVGVSMSRHVSWQPWLFQRCSMLTICLSNRQQHSMLGLLVRQQSKYSTLPSQIPRSALVLKMA